jgi:hypothetical protein
MPDVHACSDFVWKAESTGSLSLACSFSEIGIGLVTPLDRKISSGRSTKRLNREIVFALKKGGRKTKTC